MYYNDLFASQSARSEILHRLVGSHHVIVTLQCNRQSVYTRCWIGMHGKALSWGAIPGQGNDLVTAEVLLCFPHDLS